MPIKGEKFIYMYEDESYMDILTSDMKDFSEYADEDVTDECFPITAALPLSNNKPLEGVPLLPGLEDYKKISEDAWNSLTGIEHCTKEDKMFWKDGFQYAKAAGGYTEDDMKAVVKAHESYMINGDHDIHKTPKAFVEQFIQSLKKYPIAFEAEMVEDKDNLCDCYYTKFCISTQLEKGIRCRDIKYYKPKIEKNTLQGEWIYE